MNKSSIRIKLELLNQRLLLYLKAEQAILSGQAYKVEGLELTRADLSAVQNMIRKLQDDIDALEAKLNFQSSYSASRGALLEAWKVFRYWRSWWEINFCQPIYEEWLEEAILKGRVNAPGYFEDPVKRYAYTWADWTGPSQGQLNPVQEVQAAALRVENGFSTRQKETAELTGTDFELNHRQRVKEELLRKELINAQG